jgi:hypothetical protein
LQAHLEKVKLLHQKDIEAEYGEVYLSDALSRKYPGAVKDWCWQYVFPAVRLSLDLRVAKYAVIILTQHPSESHPFRIAVQKSKYC